MRCEVGECDEVWGAECDCDVKCTLFSACRMKCGAASASGEYEVCKMTFMVWSVWSVECGASCLRVKFFRAKWDVLTAKCWVWSEAGEFAQSDMLRPKLSDYKKFGPQTKALQNMFMFVFPFVSIGFRFSSVSSCQFLDVAFIFHVFCFFISVFFICVFMFSCFSYFFHVVVCYFFLFFSFFFMSIFGSHFLY